MAADADIYWVAGTGGNRIARADDNGTGVNLRFVAGLHDVGSLAVGAGDLYWTGGGSIGRAKLDGSGVDRRFIRGLGQLDGVAVDRSLIYWLSDNDPACGDKPGFGRAGLDGSRLKRGFACGARGRRPVADDGYPSGIAVEGNYLYWGWVGGIGRLATNGVDRYKNNFITMPRGLAAAGVTAGDGHLYWGTYSPGPWIGRADLLGTAVNTGFINSTAGNVVPAVTVGEHYLYFTNDYTSGATIARSTLGGVVSWDFISGLDAVGDLVVGPGAP